jgi:SRSO17 transposase
MTLQQIAALGNQLVSFLALFADCFGRIEGRRLLAVYVRGQLSDLHRKTAEAIALRMGKAPRTLQRFLELIKWNEDRLRERCQQLVAREHAHAELYLPEEWANNPARRKKTTYPTKYSFAPNRRLPWN